MSALQLGPASSEGFRAEAYHTLQRAWEEDHAVKNVEVEFGLLVPAFNAGVDAARKEVLRFFVGKVDVTKGAQGVLGSASAIFTRWGGLAVKYAGRERASVVLDIQGVCVESESEGEEGVGKWFPVLLRAAYESDMVDEGALIRWRDLPEAKGEGGVVGTGEKSAWEGMWKKGKVYVDVLEQMESDDESSEEESEEESD